MQKYFLALVNNVEKSLLQEQKQLRMQIEDERIRRE
jgi:hypothetical protein